MIETKSTVGSTNGHAIDYVAEAGAVLYTPEQVAAERIKEEAEAALLNAGAHDEGHAQVFNLRYQGRFLHSDALGWMHHTGTHWTSEAAEAALDRAMVDTLQARIEAALRSGRADQYADLIKKSIPSAGHIAGAKSNLSSIVVALPGDFDTDPDLLNCPNGVVDLRTGDLRPHRWADRFMHCTKVNYAPTADPSPWVKWLTEAVDSKPVVDWLQLAVGYSLTGHTREEILLYLFGPPRSGKGTFTETLLALLGAPLAKEVNFGTFTAQRTGDSQNFDLAPLKPCRLVAASESNAYERFNEAKVKALTGGNEVFCAFKHRTHFSYRPQYKIWLSSNQPVNADPDDDAVWGRLRVIHFPHSHLGTEDKLMKEAMRRPATLEGVLAWAVAGAVKWYKLGRTGLPELAGSAALKKAHRDQLDHVGMWMEDCCLVGSDGFTPTATLYLSYETWCHRNGYEPKKQRGFANAIVRKGIKTDRRTDCRGFAGIGIKPAPIVTV